MTHLSSDGGSLPPSSTPVRQSSIRAPSRRPVLPHPFGGRTLLLLQIASRQARLTELETEMIAACEAAAIGPHAPARVPGGRERWNRACWQRYLAAAMRLEAVYGPRMRRLRQEIGQLERLKTLLGTG